MLVEKIHQQVVTSQASLPIHVHTVDTGIGVILAGTFYNLIVTQRLIDIWVAFGMGKPYRFYHINASFASLGSKNHEHYRYLCFTYFWDVTQHLPSEIKARSRFGRHILVSLIHLCI